ncbi:aminotransferase class I/II-fold pyridoxal phosphate-dependent enzyme [Halarcobacter anaerophilus]|uniref:Aminotransferase class I/II n=1 Tax=Halarcobacter anaerophilus TaxID=877500 RepID=A0A4Q0Y3V7_9BACT|nr:aminotransferase class I/II-fold pyridoxal phosphate-dependent enzyme [Halarcobacter anaerophilus]QDF29131.1 L-threonine-O-3-phosphate decarboxylase [Halarcobacter anaerophilus]RXJ64876.1 aminotransferase class I/II [Halarcobacter anaerophilus]
MKKFQHGGDLNSFAKSLDCNINKITDLSSNINFIKPKLKCDFNTLDISSYPTYENLYKIVAKKYKVKASQIELYNGASSAIFTLFRKLALKTCVIYSPAYLEYKKASKLFGYNLQQINRFKNINEKIEKDSLVVFVNPSTPDGKYYDIKNLMQKWIKKRCTVLIDESFLEFTKNKSDLKYLKEYENLYILKSMTKFYSCAGVRVATLISTKENIKKLKEKEPLWKLSAYDMNYIINALKDKKFVKKSTEKNLQNKQFLREVLRQYSFIKLYKSDANFFLIKLKNIDADTLQNHLKKYKIMIRNCDNFDFLDKSFVRVAVKEKKSIKLLQKALDRI